MLRRMQQCAGLQLPSRITISCVAVILQALHVIIINLVFQDESPINAAIIIILISVFETELSKLCAVRES